MNSKFWCVILAAGESKRFKESGYDRPKPLLNLRAPDGRVEWMVNFIEESIPQDIRRIIALTAFKPSVKELGGRSLFQCLEMSLELAEKTTERNFIQHITNTVGQADTVYQTIKHLPPDDSCLVVDCDTLLKTKDIQKLIEISSIYDVVLAVKETFDPNMSRVDQIPFPTMFVEKEPVSQYGIVGARAFKNIGILTKALEKTLKDCKKSKKEPYISMAINDYPGIKFAVLVDEFVDLGTPERIKMAGWEIIK